MCALNVNQSIILSHLFSYGIFQYLSIKIITENDFPDKMHFLNTEGSYKCKKIKKINWV